MRYIDDIKEATIAIANDEEVIFVIHEKNKYAIFLYGFYQFKYHTNKEFKHISYQKTKDMLYYFLLCISKISFGVYKLTYDYK